jgi:predicted ATP-grasp superfamily ATP-dependent carboligase
MRRRGLARHSAEVGAVVLGGDYQGLGIARSLGRHGVPVCVLDDEHSIASASRYVGRRVRVADLRTVDGTVDALIRAADTMSLDGWVVYPTRDEMVAAIAGSRDRLATRFRIPTPGWESVSAVWDKRETYRLAAELGIATPRTWTPRDEGELSQTPTDAPLVIKPAVKEKFFYATGAKAWRADDAASLRESYRRAAAIVPPGEVMIQELVPGGGDTQYAYCALFKEGAAVADMTVRRRRQHPSDFGRSSTFVETVDLPLLAEPSARFLKAIDFYGLVELEYKHDRSDGEWKLLDVNARTWGYHTLGPAAGVHFPYLLYRDQIGLAVPRQHARPGVRWIRVLTDVPNAVRDVAAGDIKVGEYLRTLGNVDTEAVFSWRDPLPGLYELALLPYLAVKRGL